MIARFLARFRHPRTVHLFGWRLDIYRISQLKEDE